MWSSAAHPAGRHRAMSPAARVSRQCIMRSIRVIGNPMFSRNARIEEDLSRYAKENEKRRVQFVGL
ncbi:conserved hypothetical protein [Burkholderia pseudomallei 576]|nr:conserved hypothetical protein [Burkholderia pseudomallei 576]